MSPDRPGADAPFDTLVISLDQDAARLKVTLASCAAVGIRAERLPAVTPDSLPARMHPWFHDRTGRVHGNLIPGEIGCYASHLLAMESAIARGRPVLVLEDDADLSPVMARLADMIVAAPKGWGFLRLSSPPKQMCLRVAHGDGFDIVSYWRAPALTAGYVVTPEGARRFLAAFATRHRPVHEDLRREWLHGAPCYGVVPAPVTPRAGVSSIDPGAGRDLMGRKRAMGRMNGVAAWAWRLQRWGASGLVVCTLRNLLWSVRKRLGRRPSESELVMDPPLRRRG